MLTGCDIIDGTSAEEALTKISYFNDRVQAGCSIRTGLRQPIRKADDAAVPVQRLLPGGRGAGGRQGRLRVRSRRPGRQQEAWTLDELYALPGSTQITRHVCVEGWSAIGKWSGRARCRNSSIASAPTRARNMSGSAAPRAIATSIDMATAMHPQTQMTFKFDGEILPRKYGFPMKIRIPTKLGFKNPEARDGDGRHQQWNPRLLGGAGLQLVQRAVVARLFPCAARSVISRAPRWNVR